MIFGTLQQCFVVDTSLNSIIVNLTRESGAIWGHRSKFKATGGKQELSNRWNGRLRLQSKPELEIANK